MSEAFKYDVFISHSAKDKPVVRELAERLRADGLKVWFDEWEIRPGDIIGLKIERGLEQSRTLVIIMSANAFASDWMALERSTAIFRDPINTQRRFIPVQLDDAEIKDSLKQFAYIDWRRKSEEEYARLLAACRATPLEAVMPARGERSLARVFKGHKGRVQCVALTPDGQQIVSGSSDGGLRFWELKSGNNLAKLSVGSGIWSIAVSSDGKQIVAGLQDGSVRVWDSDRRKNILTFNGHSDVVRGVALTPDGRYAVSGSADKTIRLWNLAGVCLRVLEGHTGRVNSVAITADGRHIISASEDKTLIVWDLESGKSLHVLRGHTQSVQCVASTFERGRFVSGSCDQTVRLWEVETGICLMTLQGHSEDVLSVTADAQSIVSASRDRTVRVWDLNSGACNLILRGHTKEVTDVALNPDGRVVVSASFDKTVRVWSLPTSNINLEPIHYTNAKVLLVGDSGVGKSGLALRLAENRFERTASKHAAWVARLNLRDDADNDRREREIWLWDLAGQSDYQLIHQLFMDETSLALLVFNPTQENSLEDLRQWDRALELAARRPFRKLLVAGRCDRGGLIFSRKSIELFMKERGFSGYFETSAATGAGCDKLRDAIIRNIPWDEIPWTTSPRTFKLLKDEIYKLRDQGRVLLRMSELRQQLEMALPAENFTLEHLRSVIGLLAGQGIVWRVEFGDFLLLHPEYLNSYAAALIRTVRAHPDELGSIAEEEVLMGNLPYLKSSERLPREEEQIVLRAMYQTFVDHGLCLREHTDAGTQLVFPSYFRRERPPSETASKPYVTYQFSGPLDEIYSTLVVRLHYTVTFEKDHLWRNDADFKTLEGQRISIKLTKKSGGVGELGISFEEGIPDVAKLMFIRYVDHHLNEKAQDIVRVRHYSCPHCTTPVDPENARLRLNREEKDVRCTVCFGQVPLVDIFEQQFVSDDLSVKVREMAELSRASIDSESRELILLGQAFSVAGEAGQIFRPTSAANEVGIDGEIEFKNEQGQPSGRRIYLQFKDGDHYLRSLRADGTEIFTIKNPRHAEYWKTQAYPVMLVVRNHDGQILWMNVTEYLRSKKTEDKTDQILFSGEPFTVLNLVRVRDSLASRGFAQASELAKRGHRCLETGQLDEAVGQFTEFLKLGRPDRSDLDWQTVRSGLLEVARRSIDKSPGRTNLALATLIKEAPEWLARRLCRDVNLTSATLGSSLSVDLEMHLMPVTLIAANSNGFGWDVQLTPVNSESSGTQTVALSPTARIIGGKIVRLTAQTPNLSTALYLLTVRFLEGEKVYWQSDTSLSRGEFKNPYIAGPPIRKPEFFFGRDDLLKEVGSWLEDYSVVLLGPRRSGKTSFLYQLARIFSSRKITVSIDLHTFAGYSSTKVAAGLRRDIFRACVPSATGRVPSDFRGLQRKIQEAGVEQLLILLDEMAVLAKHPTVALQLRAMSKWQQPATSLIVAGTISDEQKVSASALDIGSPPFNEFRVCKLEEISSRHARELLEKPVLGFYRYESSAIEMLLKLGGGQPFFLNILGQLVLKFVQYEKEFIIRPKHVDAARKEAVYELGRWFQEFVVELAPATRNALPTLVRDYSENLPPVHCESLQNGGLTVGPRSQLRLSPLFTDWWNSNLREEPRS